MVVEKRIYTFLHAPIFLNREWIYTEFDLCWWNVQEQKYGENLWMIRLEGDPGNGGVQT